MAVIKVPKPPKSAFDPNRPANTLLLNQIAHLHEAEKKLPSRYRSEIYINAIKTEGEAAEYIRKVTEAIHAAHDDAVKRRARAARKGKGVIEIAAVADERAERKRAPAKKKSSKKTRPKK